jgi:two-component system OmpR family sensor kinase
MKILEKNREFQSNKALMRIKRSIDDMSELHNNLTILLEEETMMMQSQNLEPIIEDVVFIHEKIYEDIHFEVNVRDFFVTINQNALKQVLVNLISNACKYNAKSGFIKIYTQDKILYIEDSGIGIKNPHEIFERSYKEQKSGHGIGLDIAKRLCEAMEIKISALSEVGRGTVVSLEFTH